VAIFLIWSANSNGQLANGDSQLLLSSLRLILQGKSRQLLPYKKCSSVSAKVLLTSPWVTADYLSLSNSLSCLLMLLLNTRARGSGKHLEFFPLILSAIKHLPWWMQLPSGDTQAMIILDWATTLAYFYYNS